MDERHQDINNVRVIGTILLVAGLLAAGVDLLTGDRPPGRGHILIGLLVIAGLALRLEAALRLPRG